MSPSRLQISPHVKSQGPDGTASQSFVLLPFSCREFKRAQIFARARLIKVPLQPRRIKTRSVSASDLFWGFYFPFPNELNFICTDAAGLEGPSLQIRGDSALAATQPKVGTSNNALVTVKFPRGQCA